MTTQIRIEESDGEDLEFGDMAPSDEAELRKLARFLRDCDLAFMFPESCFITVESEVPRSVGLGSSAALCTAIVRALNPTLPDDRLELWRWANTLESYFHGTPSGIDTGLARSEGVTAFTPAPTEIPRATRLVTFSFALVVGTVARSGSTKKHVSRVREKMQRGDSETIRVIEKLGELSQRAIDMLQSDSRYSSDAAAIGSYANEAHAELQKLGLSVETTDYLIEKGRSVGSLGGKLSGAGGGGAFFLIFEGSDQAIEASTVLRQKVDSLELPARICGAFSVARTGVVAFGS